MTERFVLADVVPSMKWGFLADNFALLLRTPRGGQPLTEDENAIVEGAIEFLGTVLEGIENFGQSRFEQGGIGKIVESLTVYGYASQALPAIPLEDKQKFKEKIGDLLQLCENLKRERAVMDTREIKEFFSAIAQITLMETNSILSSREPGPRWELSKSLPGRS